MRTITAADVSRFLYNNWDPLEVKGLADYFRTDDEYNALARSIHHLLEGGTTANEIADLLDEFLVDVRLPPNRERNEAVGEALLRIADE